jgi:hypothetical protein
LATRLPRLVELTPNSGENMCHAEEHTQAQSKKEQKALCPNFSGFSFFY